MYSYIPNHLDIVLKNHYKKYKVIFKKYDKVISMRKDSIEYNNNLNSNYMAEYYGCCLKCCY